MLCECHRIYERCCADFHFDQLHSGDDLGEEETETPSYLTDGPSALPDVVNDPIKAPAKPEAVSSAVL